VALAGGSVAFDITVDVKGYGKISLIPITQDTIWSVRSSWTANRSSAAFCPPNGMSARTASARVDGSAISRSAAPSSHSASRKAAKTTRSRLH